MRQGRVLFNNIVCGIISEEAENKYLFKYEDMYYSDSRLPAISVTLSKTKQVHLSSGLFPFFYNMLSEGANRRVQCRILKTDETDDFGLLLKTGANETAGAITVEEIHGE